MVVSVGSSAHGNENVRFYPSLIRVDYQDKLITMTTEGD
jgi:hypothetical protein